LLPQRLLAALRPDPATSLELPRDLLHDSRRRVRVAAALAVLAYGVFLTVELSRVVGGSDLEHAIDVTHDLLGLTLCGSLLLVASLRSIGDRSVLRIALAGEVLLSALISLAVPWAAYVRLGHLPGLTWVVPVIILFPLLVPAAPATSVLVSILSASTIPAGLFVLSSTNRIAVHASDYWAQCVTAAVAVFTASIAARTIYGANRQAAAARRMGSYELIAPLGHGGMGEVWKAEHLLLSRPAAVKLILPERLTVASEQRDEVVKRFTREAQVTASLRSPHTVSLFDFGTSADGTFYFAMELLDGLNAERFIYRFGPLEPRRVVHWLLQACHSLGEAHARNLVHRDIKPANLFVCRYGRDVDFVKVLDFGLIKPLVPPTDVGLTSAGVRLGTPGYMAPEQVFGLATDPRTDLYALGCVAYWLICGKKPFEAESAGELMRLHAQATPPTVSSQAPGPVPKRLEALILSCLAKEPAGRPIDADHVAAELRQCLEDEPQWSDEDAQAWWARNLQET
jgi:serine/threonine-protein kinase